jgi:hypothetical protein
MTKEGLPIADLETVRNFVVNRNSGLPRLVDDFDRRNPNLGDVIAAEFMQLGEGIYGDIIYGAIIAGVLLENSPKEAGDFVPEKITKGNVENALVSLLDNTDEGRLVVRDKLVEEQKEIFAGIYYFSRIVLGRESHGMFFLGGIITILTYEGILETRELEDKVNLEGLA